MKRKIVLWGTNEKEEKILVALHLQDKEGIVKLYTFNEEQATEDFYNKMLNQWRENQEVEFPEGYTVEDRPLNISDSILPDNVKVERTDIISRAQTEWHFVVYLLSYMRCIALSWKTSQKRLRISKITITKYGMR